MLGEKRENLPENVCDHFKKKLLMIQNSNGNNDLYLKRNQLFIKCYTKFKL